MFAVSSKCGTHLTERETAVRRIKKVPEENADRMIAHRKLATCVFYVSLVVFLHLNKQAYGEADQCTNGVYRAGSGCGQDSPYLCRGRNEADDEGSCHSDGLCCCESRDGFFSSACTDGDVCCDGGCCDPKKSFCCGGGCCDIESEVCCGDECVGKSSVGTRVGMPTLIHIGLGLLLYCFVCKAPKPMRLGRLTSFALVLTVFGFLQMLIALSSWDCSEGLKGVVAIGTIEAFLGIFIVVIRVGHAKSNGESVLAIFALERFILVVADKDGEVVGVEMADRKTIEIAKKEIEAQKDGDEGRANQLALRIQS